MKFMIVKKKTKQIHKLRNKTQQIHIKNIEVTHPRSHPRSHPGWFLSGATPGGSGGGFSDGYSLFLPKDASEPVKWGWLHALSDLS